jgi:hypothetical protein
MMNLKELWAQVAGAPLDAEVVIAFTETTYEDDSEIEEDVLVPVGHVNFDRQTNTITIYEVKQ